MRNVPGYMLKLLDRVSSIEGSAFIIAFISAHYDHLSVYLLLFHYALVIINNNALIVCYLLCVNISVVTAVVANRRNDRMPPVLQNYLPPSAPLSISLSLSFSFSISICIKFHILSSPNISFFLSLILLLILKEHLNESVSLAAQSMAY